MLEFYKLRVDRGTLKFSAVPDPYYTQMYESGYREPVEEGEGEAE